jgi:hypothetical protein
MTEKIKVLGIPFWYPSVNDSEYGIFLKNKLKLYLPI